MDPEIGNNMEHGGYSICLSLLNSVSNLVLSFMNGYLAVDIGRYLYTQSCHSLMAIAIILDCCNL